MRDPQLMREKLRAIGGDVLAPNLGVAPEDVEKLKDVSVVFHSAATIRFDEKIKDAVEMNIKWVLLGRGRRWGERRLGVRSKAKKLEQKRIGKCGTKEQAVVGKKKNKRNTKE